MIRIIGVVMIMCAGVGCGFSLSSRVKEHLRKVSAINDMFSEVIMLIAYNAVTFRELIAYLKDRSLTSSLKFLDVDVDSVDIRENVVQAVRENQDNLEEEEVRQLCGFFMQFGTSDLEGQLLMARKYQEYFRTRLQDLREESMKKCRLYNSLGALGGAFIAVILV